MANIKYRSDAFASIHETEEALRDIGAIDKRTMREFDAACLAPLPNYTGRQIRKIREREKISQPVFAHDPRRVEEPGERLGAGHQEARWPDQAIAFYRGEARARRAGRVGKGARTNASGP